MLINGGPSAAPGTKDCMPLFNKIYQQTNVTLTS